MGKYVLEGKVISANNIGEKIYITRLSTFHLDKRIPFKFKRRQFVSFAMTTNNSQGQSPKHINVYLQQSIFSHAQLYILQCQV
jgi:ATP-dependent DNA helicase PIF1